MSKVVIASRPITDSSGAYLLLEDEDHNLERYLLGDGEPLHVTITDPVKKYCVGWYDVNTHTNHVCNGSREVDSKYESCFECRHKTGFNPAFYNSSKISTVQEEYNNKPHSVYISYFGAGLTKAGIMSNSRNLDRLFEQGALFYCIIGTFENADAAHEIESQLINSGLRNSITKKQKEKVLSESFSEDAEREVFLNVLKDLSLDDKIVISNLSHFFFGRYLNKTIEPLGKNPISGAIRGIIGRYLVLDNNDRLYGYWLSNLSGFQVEIDKEVMEIEVESEQISLFDK